MRRLCLAALFAVSHSHAQSLGNELIDYDGFERNVGKVKSLREARRISEEQFLRMAAEPGTVVLDARSDRLFRL